MQRAATTQGTALADLRSREDGLRRHLEAVRTHLARCVQLGRELPELERRVETERARGGAYRTHAADLDRELAEARAARGERARLRIEEAAIMTELENVRASLERRGIRHVALPMLDKVQVAAPCDVSWADMEGDHDTRFCTQCNKHVHNLSMMSREEAEAVVAASAGKGLCIRLYRRTDGTILTDDCPVGVRRQRFWRRTTGVAAAGLLLAALGTVYYSQLVCTTHVVGTSAVGGAMGGFP